MKHKAAFSEECGEKFRVGQAYDELQNKKTGRARAGLYLRTASSPQVPFPAGNQPSSTSPLNKQSCDRHHGFPGKHPPRAPEYRVS
jgi:hypothetical protein